MNKYNTINIKNELPELLEAICNQTYTRKGFQIVTLPLNKSGYKATDGDLKLIFVNSKLPKSKRTEVIQTLMEKI